MAGVTSRDVSVANPQVQNKLSCFFLSPKIFLHLNHPQLSVDKAVEVTFNYI